MNSVQYPTARAKRTISGLGVVFGLLLLSFPVFSQGSFGRILGIVTDQSGGVIADATITITDKDRGVARTLTTDEAGEYNAPTLLPGTYTVRVEAKGFQTIERQNVVLQVGQEVRVDLTPQPGEQAQTVTVTESLPLVETTNATLGGTLNNAEIGDMPLNGRNYQNLVALRPGIVQQPGGGPWTQSTNGVRPDETVWMVDGVINENFYDARPVANMPSPFSDGASILPIDAIQEFDTEISPKAEFGWKPGAVVNVGVKSGTNQLHGAAYGFYRSAAWDARNFFNPDVNSAPVVCAPIASGGNPASCAKLPTQLRQFGGVVGGPVKKDKLFFFAGYEGLRSLIGNAIVTGGVPETISTGSAKKSMVDAINALKVAGVTPSTVSLKLACPNAIGQTLPLAANFACIPPSFSWPSQPFNTTGFTAFFPNSNVTDNGIAKIDYHINTKNTINGMFMDSSYTGDGMDHPFVNSIFRDTNIDRTYTGSGDWVWTPNSRLVNDARFGYDKVTFNFLTDDGTIKADGAGFPINTGVTQVGGLPNINLSGFEKLGSWHNRPQHWATWYSDFQDNLSYLVGKHTFKFGGEYTHINVTNAIPDTVRGRIDFRGGATSQIAGSTPLEDFFAGNPSRGFILTGNAGREETWNSISGFAQDDWRVTSKFTLNAGLRYTYTSPIHEVNGLWGNFDPTRGMVQQGQPGVGDTLWKPDHLDFSPRLGFAWDLSGRGTTVVRGGFSIIYSSFTAVTFLNQNGFNNSTAVSVAAVPTGACTAKVTAGNTCSSVGGQTFGGSIDLASTKVSVSSPQWNSAAGSPGIFAGGATPSCTPTSQCNLLAVDPNLKTPYIENFSLGIQHQFGNNLSLEVGYVGNHGARLTGFRDINQITDFNTSAQPYSTSFPYLNFINQLSNDGRSNYNGLQTTLTKRLSHGLSFIAGYTYAHDLDTVSLNRTAYLPQDSRNPGLEYGSGDFDVRHHFTFTTTYNIPGVKGFGQLLEGWKINSIVTIQSPQPWLVADFSNDFLGGDSTDRWNITGDPANIRSGPNSIPFCLPDPKTAVIGCSQYSGISQQSTPFSAAQTTSMWNQCLAAAGAFPGSLANLNPANPAKSLGCFVAGNTVLTPPANNSFGNIGRNIFRDSGFKDMDFSVFKNFTYKERYGAEFRVELFNVFNHPISANPYGSANGYGVGNDLSSNTFGCGCATADVAAGSPQIGSGGARALQLGLKLTF